MKTTFHANAATANQQWVQLSAKGQILGRLAARVAQILQGKHKPTYTPHCDTGDFVVVTDAEHIQVTGNKATQKTYIHHTGYVGHLRERTYAEVFESDPAEVLRIAVRRMLPKTKLGKTMFTKLKVVTGDKHPHEAQKPKAITL